MNEDGIEGDSTARREPRDIGIPRAVVFLMRKGIGFVTPEISFEIAFSKNRVEFSLNRS